MENENIRFGPVFQWKHAVDRIRSDLRDVLFILTPCTHANVAVPEIFATPLHYNAVKSIFVGANDSVWILKKGSLHW